ncbi:hypothetical protein INT45_006547 [Circinella minor]|uniref:Uncharacterized protein n=1 Tax=Circinella minor TaxID=1195481 RepID=A0A8H7S090_9FUNG|nr:hypothetical protein INT45_006547 [Circinella minor]
MDQHIAYIRKSPTPCSQSSRCRLLQTMRTKVDQQMPLMNENVEEVVVDHGSEIEVLDKFSLLDKGIIFKFDCRAETVKHSII